MASGRDTTDGYCRAVSAFFNHAGASPPTDPVVERMIRHLRREQEIGGYEAAAEVVDELAAVRGTLATAVGAHTDEIALTTGATDAWERVCWAFLSAPRFDDGAHVVTDPFTYISMWTTLARWRSMRPLDVEVAAPAPDGTVDLDALAALVRPDTAAVLLTHIPTHRGTVTPAAAAVAAARAASPDALIVLDVSQSAGQLPLDLAALGPDVAFAPGRKFLRGPRGTGFLRVRRDLVPALVPLGLPGAAGLDGGAIVGLPDDATRFEVFERSIAAFLGFGVAVGELVTIGLDGVAAAVGARSREVRDAVASNPALVLLGGPDDRGIVTFTHRNHPPHVVAERLTDMGIASRYIPGVDANPDGQGRFDGCVRLSPHHCTTDDEVARLGDALARLA